VLIHINVYDEKYNTLRLRTWLNTDEYIIIT
jgi:hypothetical protein